MRPRRRSPLPQESGFGVFFQALSAVFGGMTTLFLISLLGFLAVRRRVVDDAAVNSIARLLVDVIVPAKMAVAMAAGLNEETLSQAGTVMLIMLAWNLGLLGLGWMGTRLWPGGRAGENHALPVLASFQNGIYVPLPLVLALVATSRAHEATVLVGGAVVVMTATQWTLGVYLLRGENWRPRAGAPWRETLVGALNPPVISIFLGALLSLVGPVAAAARGETAPFYVIVPVRAAEVLGSALAPVAMILLGMLIGQCRLRGVLSWRGITIPFVLKMLLAPLAMLAALSTSLLGWVPPLVALVLIIQAASPPATNLSVIARRYDGDWQLVSGTLLVTYLAALVTMPLFTALMVLRILDAGGGGIFSGSAFY